MHQVIDRRDLDFLMFEWLRLGDLLKRDRFCDHDPADIAAMLDLAHRLAEREVAPHLRASDQKEPWLDADGDVHVLPEVARAVRLISESGLLGSVFDGELGGLQLPYLVHMSAMGVLMGGSIATASYMLLTVANARVIATFGNSAQIDRFAKPQISGSALGTMCLSEPHAGSSLGDVRTRAEFEGEDEWGPRYRLFGSKMWISGGDHDVTDQIVHLVLAKAPGPDGTIAEGGKGLSLFIVPKLLADGSRNDISVVGLNHKLGYRGIPNCALNFGDGRSAPDGRTGAVGWRIGEVGQGLPQMFQMMNEARVSVGLGGAMLAYRGWLLALDYARNRPQGRARGKQDGDQVAIVQHADVQRMLFAQKAYAEGALALALFTARLLDEEATGSASEREAAAALLGILTPVTKTWPSEWAQHSLNDAIQVHGGAGYTRDFEVELLYRDNRLNPIHEGTTGIQGLDLVGRKLRRDRGVAFGVLRARVDETLARAKSSTRLAADAAAVSAAWAAVAEAAERLLKEPDAASASALATPFLFAMGHAVVGWLWLDQALLCAPGAGDLPDGAERTFRMGKLSACRYFVAFELPKVNAWLAPILNGMDFAAELTPQVLEGASA